MVKKYEGYWRNDQEESSNLMPWEIKGLPWPKVELTRCDETLISKLKQIFAQADQKSYFGSSECRICGQSNGCLEYWLNQDQVTYVVPEGYLHYLEQHNVHPSREFIDFINYYY